MTRGVWWVVSEIQVCWYARHTTAIEPARLKKNYSRPGPNERTVVVALQAIEEAVNRLPHA